jgi:hypothetical protein
VLLNETTDFAQISEFSGLGSCGSSLPSPNFNPATVAANPGGNSGTQIFVFGIPTHISNSYILCYCPGMSGCANHTVFTNPGGVLTVRGPLGGQDFFGTAGLALTIGPFTGILLASTDEVMFVRTSNYTSCLLDSREAADTIALGQSRNVSASLFVSLSISDLPKGGSWIICYCTTYDDSMSNLPTGNGITCDIDSEFTAPSGSLTLRGADGIGTYTCVRYAPACEITVNGVLMDSNDHVQAVDTGFCSMLHNQRIFIRHDNSETPGQLAPASSR